MSRRRFLHTQPTELIRWLLQYPYDPPSPGADTPLNLTIRVTTLEVRVSVILGMMAEMGKELKRLGSRLPQTGPYWPDRRRAT